jgi:D-glycero-D-manno-heptose 1,7-bisphosphate phosphatase
MSVPLYKHGEAVPSSASMSLLKPAIFLDRDGVVIEDSHYLGDATRIRLVPGSAKAIAALNRAGWAVVVVTNQSGVARGLFSLDSVGRVHDSLATMLAEHGSHVDAIQFCPHHPEAKLAEFRQDCDCRKPRPGMLRRAARELDLDLAASWMIGDRASDLEAGAAAGCRTVLVRTGYGTTVDVSTLDRDSLHLNLVAANLAEAVELLGLGRVSGSS